MTGWLDQIENNAATLMGALEHEVSQDRNSLIAKIGSSRRNSSIGGASAIIVPLATWFVSLLVFFNSPSSGNSSADHTPITIFLGFSIPLSGIFVLMYSLSNKRRQKLEDDLDKIDRQLLSVRKLHILSRIAVPSQDLSAFRDVTLFKGLSARSPNVKTATEDDDLSIPLGLIDAIQKLTERPKKP